MQSRSEADLKDLVDTALHVNGGGAMPIILVAKSPEESALLWALIKGRRGGKSVTIRIAKDADEFVPLIERARRKPGKPEPAPAVADDLDYDGY